MEQNKTNILSNIQQISKSFSTVQLHDNDGDDKALQMKNLKSMADVDKETSPFAIGPSYNIFSDIHSNSIRFSTTETCLKNSFHKCKVCGHTFNRTSDFLMHKMSHTDDQFFSSLPFKCPNSTCPLAFNTKKKLKIHKKTHPPNKPYQCSICSRRFLQHKSLKEHSMVCHGLKF